VHAFSVLRGLSVVCLALSACSGGGDKAPTRPPPAAPRYTLERPVDGLVAPGLRDGTFVRGVTLGPLVNAGSEPAQRAELGKALDAALELGATDIELVVQWAQTSVSSVELSPQDHTLEDERLIWLMDEAHAKKLRVLVTPTLVVDATPTGRPQASAEESERWWWSYRRFAVAYGRIAGQHHAWGLTIGTDLPLMAKDTERLEALIHDVRKVFKGKLGYGVRSSELAAVQVWPLLDFALVASGAGPARAQALDDQALAAELAKEGAGLRELAERTQKEVLLSDVPRELGQGATPPSVPPLAALRWARAGFGAWQEQSALRGAYMRALGDEPALPPVRAVARHWYTAPPQ